MKRIITVAAGLAMTAGFAVADVVAPDQVAFDDAGAVEASLSGTAGDAAAGQELMVSRAKGNCMACHQVTSIDAPFQGNVGPVLDGAGSRWEPEQLRGIVVNAKNTFPDTVMPAFYKTSGFIRAGDAFTGKAAPADLPPLLTAQEVEDVVAFLTTLKE